MVIVLNQTHKVTITSWSNEPAGMTCVYKYKFKIGQIETITISKT